MTTHVKIVYNILNTSAVLWEKIKLRLSWMGWMQQYLFYYTYHKQLYYVYNETYSIQYTVHCTVGWIN